MAEEDLEEKGRPWSIGVGQADDLRGVRALPSRGGAEEPLADAACRRSSCRLLRDKLDCELSDPCAGHMVRAGS